MLKASLAALLLLLVFGPAVSAQTDSVVAVGGAVTFLAPTNAQVDFHFGVGLTSRLRRGSGLGFSLGFEWSTADVQTEIDGQSAPLGTMHIRPLMLGVSYSRQFARFCVSAGLVGGWSFNSLTQTPGQQRAYGEVVGMPDAQVSIANGWAVRPSITLWWELGNHFGAFVSTGYIFDRPTVTTRGAAGQRRDTVNLDATIFSVGLAYGIF